jgi:hypothetical protein
VLALSTVADEELPWGTETRTQTLGFGAVVVFASTVGRGSAPSDPRLHAGIGNPAIWKWAKIRKMANDWLDHRLADDPSRTTGPEEGRRGNKQTQRASRFRQGGFGKKA